MFESTDLNVTTRNLLMNQLLYRSREDRDEQFTRLLRMFPDARVHVVVKTDEDREHIARLVFKRLRERIWDGSDDVGTKHIYVTTTYAIDPHIHFLIVWDFTICLTRYFRVQRPGFKHASCVAFRLGGRRHTRRLELMLEAYVGPRLDLFRPSSTTKVKVLVTPSSSSAPKGKRRKPRSRSQMIWNNNNRNRQVVEIATRLAGTAKKSKDAESKAIVAQVREWLGVDERLYVAVLVESKQHADALGELLPRWRRHTTIVEPSVRRRPRLPSDEIITALYAADVAEIDADVIVRADGGAVSTERFEAMLAKVSGRNVAVVDIVEECDLAGVIRASERVAEYQRRGWEVQRMQA